MFCDLVCEAGVYGMMFEDYKLFRQILSAHSWEQIPAVILSTSVTAFYTESIWFVSNSGAADYTVRIKLQGKAVL